VGLRGSKYKKSLHLAIQTKITATRCAVFMTPQETEHLIHLSPFFILTELSTTIWTDSDIFIAVIILCWDVRMLSAREDSDIVETHVLRIFWVPATF
jgi:hypothetical protein